MLSHKEIFQIVAESRVTETTILRFIEGLPCNRSSCERIVEAANKLQIELPDVVHPPVTRKPRSAT